MTGVLEVKGNGMKKNKKLLCEKFFLRWEKYPECSSTFRFCSFIFYLFIAMNAQSAFNYQWFTVCCKMMIKSMQPWLHVSSQNIKSYKNLQPLDLHILYNLFLDCINIQCRSIVFLLFDVS